MTPIIKIAFAALALSLALAPAASAQDAGATDIKISYSDLDLSLSSDARVLLSRIETASRAVCVAPGFETLTSVRGCARKLLAHAVSRIGAPELTRAFKTQAKARGSQLAGR